MNKCANCKHYVITDSRTNWNDQPTTYVYGCDLKECSRDPKEPEHECPVCGKMFPRSEMQFTTDCHGITYRLVCLDCYDKIMDEKGYDGQYYTEADECIDYDY